MAKKMSLGGAIRRRRQARLLKKDAADQRSSATSLLGKSSVPTKKGIEVRKDRVYQGGEKLRASGTAKVSAPKPKRAMSAGRITGRGSTAPKITPSEVGSREKLDGARKANMATSTANVKGGRSNSYHKFLGGFMDPIKKVKPKRPKYSLKRK